MQKNTEKRKVYWIKFSYNFMKILFQILILYFQIIIFQKLSLSWKKVMYEN